MPAPVGGRSAFQGEIQRAQLTDDEESSTDDDNDDEIRSPGKPWPPPGTAGIHSSEDDSSDISSARPSSRMAQTHQQTQPPASGAGVTGRASLTDDDSESSGASTTSREASRSRMSSASRSPAHSKTQTTSASHASRHQQPKGRYLGTPREGTPRESLSERKNSIAETSDEEDGQTTGRSSVVSSKGQGFHSSTKERSIDPDRHEKERRQEKERELRERQAREEKERQRKEGERKEEERRKREEEVRLARQERLQAEQEQHKMEERKREEGKKKKDAEEAVERSRREAEEARLQEEERKKQDEELRRKLEEEQKRRAQEEEAEVRRKVEEEERLIVEKERLRVEEVERQKWEAEWRRKEEERIKAEEKELQRQKEQEEKAKREAQEAARRKALEEQRRRKEDEFWASLSPEEAIRMRALQQAVNLCRQQLQRGEQSIIDLQTQVAERERNCQELRKTSERAMAERDAAHKKAQQNQEAIDRMQARRTVYAEAGIDIQALQSKLHSLTAENGRLQEACVAERRDLQLLHAQAAVADQNAQESKVQYAETQARVQQDAASLRASHAEDLAALKASQTEEAAQLEAEWRQEVADLRAAHSEEITRLRCSSEDSIRRRDALRKERDATSQQLRQRQQEGVQLQQQWNDSRQEALALALQSHSLQEAENNGGTEDERHWLHAIGEGPVPIGTDAEMQALKKRCETLQKICKDWHEALERKQVECERWRRKCMDLNRSTSGAPFTLGPAENDGVVMLTFGAEY